MKKVSLAALLCLSLFLSYLLVQIFFEHNYFYKALRWRYAIYEPIYVGAYCVGVVQCRLWERTVIRSVLLGLALGYGAALLGYFCAVVFFPPTQIAWVAVDPVHRIVQLFLWPYFLYGILEGIVTAACFSGLVSFVRRTGQ